MLVSGDAANTMRLAVFAVPPQVGLHEPLGAKLCL